MFHSACEQLPRLPPFYFDQQNEPPEKKSWDFPAWWGDKEKGQTPYFLHFLGCSWSSKFLCFPFTHSQGEETVDWHLWSQQDLSSDFSRFWINHIVNVCYALAKDEKAQEEEIS